MADESGEDEVYQMLIKNLCSLVQQTQREALAIEKKNDTTIRSSHTTA